MTDIDLSKINEEVQNAIAGMTPEQVEKELTDLRVKQKVAQKKYQSPERQKAYQAKQKFRRQLLAAKARELGIYDAVNKKAGELADAKLAEEEVAAEGDE